MTEHEAPSGRASTVAEAAREDLFAFRRLRFISSHGWSLRMRLGRLMVAIEIGWKS